MVPNIEYVDVVACCEEKEAKAMLGKPMPGHPDLVCVNVAREQEDPAPGVKPPAYKDKTTKQMIQDPTPMIPSKVRYRMMFKPTPKPDRKDAACEEGPRP